MPGSGEGAEDWLARDGFRVHQGESYLRQLFRDLLELGWGSQDYAVQGLNPVWERRTETVALVEPCQVMRSCPMLQ